MSPSFVLPAVCGLLLLPFISLNSDSDAHEGVAVAGAPAATAPADNRYIGAGQCKNCHNADDAGAMHDAWASSAHAGTYELLGSDEAKAVAKEMGIDDPQKSEKCLKCHVTAYGVDKELKKKSFDMADGVQCETCHGPGETHFKKRFMEKMKRVDEPSPVSADEGVKIERDPQTCLECHNEESPTYEQFCFKEKMAEIEHLDPRKERSKEELKKLRAMCLPDCPECEKDKDKDEDKDKEGV